MIEVWEALLGGWAPGHPSKSSYRADVGPLWGPSWEPIGLSKGFLRLSSASEPENQECDNTGNLQGKSMSCAF
eukprot:7293393-Pyramimonas_sp.AAC.1